MPSIFGSSSSQVQLKNASSFPRFCNLCRQQQALNPSRTVTCLHVRSRQTCTPQISIQGSEPSKESPVSCTSPSNSSEHSDSVEFIGVVVKNGTLKRSLSQSALSSSHVQSYSDQGGSNNSVPLPYTRYGRPVSSAGDPCTSTSTQRNGPCWEYPPSYDGGPSEQSSVLTNMGVTEKNSMTRYATHSSETSYIHSHLNVENEAIPTSFKAASEAFDYSDSGANATTSSSGGTREGGMFDYLHHICTSCKRIMENNPSKRIICLHKHQSIKACPAELPPQGSSDSDVALVQRNDRKRRPENISKAISIHGSGVTSASDTKVRIDGKGAIQHGDRASVHESDSIQTISRTGPCKSLSNVEISKIQNALQGRQERHSNNNAKLYGTELSSTELRGLWGSQWISDEVMNACIVLLNVRNKAYFCRKSVGGSKEIPQLLASHGDSTDCMNRMLRNSGSTFSFETRKSNMEFAPCTKEANDKVLDSAVQSHSFPKYEFSRPRTHVFNTFFTEILSKPMYGYQKVHRWLEKRGKDVLSQDLLLFPVNLNNTHWVLALIDMKRHCFVYMDSLRSPDRAGVLPLLRRWLVDEVQSVHGKEMVQRLQLESWREEVNPEHAPRQYDNGSCGVFVLYVAEHLERGVQPSFSQESIATLRNRTVLVLLDGHLPEY